MKCSSMFWFVTESIVVIINMFTWTSGYYFTSVHKTKELLIVEFKMVQILGTYIEETQNEGEEPPEDLLLFYNKALGENAEATASNGFIENPLNSLSFFKRMDKGWNRIISSINCDDYLQTVAIKKFCNDIWALQTENDIDLATMDVDVRGALIGISRLRKTYKLDIKDLLRGVILGEQGVPLTLEDVFTIQSILDEEDEFEEAVRWLQGLYDVTLTEGSAANSAKVVRQLASTLWKTKNRQLAISVLKKHQDEDPSNKRLSSDLAFYTASPAGDGEDSSLSLVEESSITETLCMGKGIQNIKVVSKLRCLYRNTVIPIYKAKEEVLSIQPRVSLFHDVVSESDQASIKQIAFAKFADSTVIYSDGSHVLDTHIRVSQTSWLDDVDSSIIQRISKRVEIITGLTTDRITEVPSAEPLQVLNYGFGGMYLPHIDNLNVTVFQNNDEVYGDRIATWMFYLNDVKAGGSTIFPKLNITVPVTKGAAAFWYNFERNGEKDERLQHSGCPVLLGSKWVANKWIREKGQIFRRRCGRTYDAADGIVDSTSLNQFQK